jgi:hypothetical protein
LVSGNAGGVVSNAFELSIIVHAGPDGLTRVVTCCPSHERESVLFESFEAELVVLRRWAEFHRRRLGFPPSWDSHAC